MTENGHQSLLEFIIFSLLDSLCVYFSLCHVAGRLLAAEAAGNSRLLQHAAAQFQRRGEGPQEAGRSPETQNKLKM